MIIQCEKCNRKFKIDDSRITHAGSKVRCSKCGHVFVVERKESAYEESGAHPAEESRRSPEESQTAGREDSVTAEAEGGGGYDVSPGPDENSESTDPGDYTPGESEPHEPDEAAAETPAENEQRPDTVNGENRVSEDDTSVLTRTERHDPDIHHVTGDEGNWEEFVNISKNEEKTDDLTIQEVQHQTGEDSDFNWDNMRIDNEADDIPERTPNMFEDEEPGHDDAREIGERAQGAGSRPEEAGKEPLSGRTPEKLTVDMDVLTNSPHVFKRPSPPSGGAPYGSMRTYTSRPTERMGLFGGIAYAVITIAVFAVIIAAAYIILLNTGIVSKESSDKLTRFIGSVVPIRIAEPFKNDVVITEHRGRWMATRNGALYVISGMIKNTSENPVNFVKIRTEFVSAGQVLYESEVYAGNTFTDNELKASPLQDILLKLKKRSGDIDYYNTKKLAGLNYNIQPGESIPFYTVFPSTSRVLGLRYELQVAGYEDSSPE